MGPASYVAEDSSSNDEDEMDLMINLVRDHVTDLLRLSLKIREAKKEDPFAKSESSPYSLADDDILSLRRQYPKLELWLAERLANALSRRGAYLLYLLNNHRRLEDVEDGVVNPDILTKVTELIESFLDVNRAEISQCTGDNEDNQDLQQPIISSSGPTRTMSSACPLCSRELKSLDVMAWK